MVSRTTFKDKQVDDKKNECKVDEPVQNR